MKSIRIIVLLALALFGNWIVAQETDANIFGHVIDKQTHGIKTKALMLLRL